MSKLEPADRPPLQEDHIERGFEELIVIIAVLLVMAQFVVTSRRCRQIMIRPISPR